MGIIPLNIVDRIEFCESHWPVWQANAASIGLTAAQTLAFKNATTAARTAYDAAQAARQAWRAAVLNQNANIEAVIGGTGGASDLIRTIKAYAQLQPDPAMVYALAEIPLPAPPTPLPAPGAPENLVVTLEPTGAITLTWEAQNAAAGTGAYYNITRKLPGETSFSLVGGAPGATAQARRMSFTDFTIPTSAAQSGAQYIIQGRRGQLIGEPSDAITVQFGVEGGAGSFVVAGASQPMKMAA